MVKKFVLWDESTKELGAADPIVASMPADIGGVYYAVKDNSSSPSYNLVPDLSSLRVSSETVIDTGNQTTTGVKETRTYSIVIPCDMIIAGKVIMVGKSGGYNAIANTGDKFRINLKVAKNGTNLVTVNGTEHTPNSTSEVNYTELLTASVPSTSFSAGDTFEITVEIEITAVDDTNPGITAKLYCDPATAGDELIFYLQL